MNITEKYEKLLKDLELGHRALIRYSQEEVEFLAHNLSNDQKNREIILTLIIHSATPHHLFEVVLIKLLKENLPTNEQIFCLNAARKHILEARRIKGLRLEFDFLEVLKSLLFSKDPEIVEWTLRTIEECGSQGIYFLKEFDKIKPPPWKWFNKHHRAAREIIAMLERRWSPYGSPQKP